MSDHHDKNCNDETIAYSRQQGVSCSTSRGRSNCSHSWAVTKNEKKLSEKFGQKWTHPSNKKIFSVNHFRFCLVQLLFFAYKTADNCNIPKRATGKLLFFAVKFMKKAIASLLQNLVEPFVATRNAASFFKLFNFFKEDIAIVIYIGYRIKTTD